MKWFKKKEESEAITKARLELRQQKEYLKMANSNLQAALREDKILSVLGMLDDALKNIEKTKKLTIQHPLHTKA